MLAHVKLSRMPDRSLITPEVVAKTVRFYAESVDVPGEQPVDQDAIVGEMIRRLSRWMSKASALKSEEVEHDEWLVSARKVGWRYWKRYQTYLAKALPQPVIAALDDATDKILGSLHDPKVEGYWDRRGLVVGHVQSGKTGNYSGLICKAADAGYKIIIVLAGMHNNLRSQTQMRLEESFLGFRTNDDGTPGAPIGVYEIDPEQSISPNCGTSRADNGDFTKTRAKSFQAISPEQRPWLFVVKKNKSVLTGLLEWLQSDRVSDAQDPVDGRPVVARLPLLVIDDESDHGSVNTGEIPLNEDGTVDEEIHPKVINGLIRQILRTFNRSAYVGYTATPFANVFIHSKVETKLEGKDLFPESFIVNLSAPSNYIGPARMFGRATTSGRVGGLPLTRDIADHLDPGQPIGWMPIKHKKDHFPSYMGQDILPPSLRDAIYSFMITCAVRYLRKQGKQHSSMLVHVTRLVDVQKRVAAQIDAFVSDARLKIETKIDHAPIINRMVELWETDFLPTSAEIETIDADLLQGARMPAWAEVLTALPQSIADIAVMAINGTAKDALDYADKEKLGFKVIAIGGEKLARGLTLEGLCASYFVRTTKMYDTLMQMGRWFGYRPGYVDLCRLYTTPDLVKWFEHIADASEELRDEFDAMAERGLTPRQYGIRVKSHPVMTVTSPVKMRASETLKLSYSGTMTQTVALVRDEDVLAKNLAVADRLVVAMDGGSKAEERPVRSRGDEQDPWSHSTLWRDVPTDSVVAFLQEFETHKAASSARSQVLAEFVRKMNEKGKLREWSVALLPAGATAPDPHVFSNGRSITNFPSRWGTLSKDGYSIGVLTDPSDEAIDLDYGPWKQALDATVADWKPDAARDRKDPPTRPNGKKLREMREAVGGAVDRPVLLIYPLSPAPVGRRPAGEEGTPPPRLVINPKWSKPVVAFAIAFPTCEDGVEVDYEVNLRYWEQEYGSAE